MQCGNFTRVMLIGCTLTMSGAALGQDGGAGGTGGGAVEGSGGGEAVVQESYLPAKPPEPGPSMSLYHTMEEWVRALKVPDDAPLDGREGTLVCTAVVLRLSGQIVGRGTLCGDDGKTLADATRMAINEALTRMPQRHDATASSQVQTFAPDLCISLELSGELVPIYPETFSQLDLEVQRGLEGLATRVGDKIVASFPSAMITSITPPADALAGTISGATGDSTAAIKINAKAQPPAIARERNAVFYRFDVSHLAQQRVGVQPVFLFRSGKVVSSLEISTTGLQDLADLLGDYLVRWDTSHRVDPDWPVGTYVPSKNSFEENTASLAEYTVVTYAIHRYIAVKSQFQDATQNAPGQPWKWHRQDRGQMAHLRFGPERLIAQPGKDLTSGPLYDAMRALVCMAPTESDPAYRGTALSALSLYDAGLASCYSMTDGWRKDIPEGARGFVAFVLAKRAHLAKGLPDEQTRLSVADAAIRSIFATNKQGTLVSQMPYLGWAELTLAKAKSLTTIPSATALREMRETVWKFQMNAVDAGAEGPDLVGGIVFVGPGMLPYPTSQSLRPLSFLATMSGDERLTDHNEALGEIAKLVNGLRFVRQLCMDEHALYIAADPFTAQWGIRASLWDQRQSPEATALGLITICEALESFHKIAQRQAAHAGTNNQPAPSSVTSSPGREK